MITTLGSRLLYHHLKTYPRVTRNWNHSYCSKQLLRHFSARTQKSRILQPSCSLNMIYRSFNRLEEQTNPHEKLANKKIIHNLVPDSARAIRLANENGYLSWCRNAYLSTGVAVMITQLGTTENFLLQYAASGALFVSLLNLLAGTTSYIVNLLAQKSSVGMSFFTTSLFMSFAVIHLFAWAFVVFLFQNHPDNELVVIEMEKEENDIFKK